MEIIDLKHILELIKEKRVELESESRFRQIWRVDSHVVMIQIKKGRRVLTCDCINHANFCNSEALCRHKEVVVGYPIAKEFLNQIRKTKINISGILLKNKKLKEMVESEFDDLQKLRWLKQLK